MYEAEFVFCILLIAAQRGDETLLLLLFYPARVPGWTFSVFRSHTLSAKVFTLFL